MSGSDPGAIPAAPAAASWEAIARAAVEAERPQQAEPIRELLVFRLRHGHYAVSIDRVREIVRARDLTPLPHAPAVVLGVTPLRGQIVQVVDLGACLGLGAAIRQRGSRIVVLNTGDGAICGALVDGVREVLRALEASLRPAPAGTPDSVGELCPRGQEFISILDVDRLLDFHARR